MNIDEIAREQFRLDTNCLKENDIGIMINESAELEGARLVDNVSSFFRAIIYKGDAYIMAAPEIMDRIREKYSDYKVEWFCKYENLRWLDGLLNEHGHKIMDTHVYLLPDPGFTDNEYEELPYDEYWLYDKEIAEWKEKYGEDNPFYHALVFSKRQPDRIGLLLTEKGDRESLAAMAGVSEDGKNLWQIGVDVLPQYAGHGMATYLTERIKNKVKETGHLPFYGTSESHSLSMDTAIRAGFLPAWAEVYVTEA